ncbi:MAG TPA: MXAN_6577-like cysteine-rich protein [Anaeromyxobacter sp.]|nr:MXAN_6577-like cysteine-rich protein [Anaeromyxobacter sp.]
MSRAILATTLAAGFALAAACTKERVCPQGETLCGGVCTSLDIDAANCGACGAACGTLQTCRAGSCGCSDGATECGGACVDLAADPLNCGACGNACPDGPDGRHCATVAGVTACTSACAGPLSDCGGACVDLASDRFNCGACGNACDAVETCRQGGCRADVYVACFATDDVRPASGALAAGLPRAAGDGPIAFAVAAGRLYAANSLSHSLSSFSLDLRDGAEAAVGGSDFEAIAEHGGRLFVSSAGSGTLIAWDPKLGAAIDEVPLGDLSGVNPRGIAFVGDRAYVALYGTNAQSGGQEVVAVDLSGVATCTTPPCGSVVRRISMLPAADADGLPFPSEVVADGTTVYVVLANLKLGSFGFYTDPAGPGKLAVIDTAAEDATRFVDLGAGCTNPGALALAGRVLWVSCGGSGVLLPVTLSGDAPSAGEPVSPPGVLAPGKLAFCGGSGYVTDQWSGTVARFDPSGLAAPASAEICPSSDAGWAWAADVECAP